MAPPARRPGPARVAPRTRQRVHCRLVPPKPGDTLDLRCDHARLRRAGRGARGRLRAVRARRRARRPRAGARHTAQEGLRRGAHARDPHSLAATACPSCATTPPTAAAASGRRCPTTCSSPSSSARSSSRWSTSAHLDGYELEPIRGMAEPWRYRNKMEFSFGEDEQGRLVLGLHRRGSWRDIVDLADCRLASERMNRGAPGRRRSLPRPGPAALRPRAPRRPAAPPRGARGAKQRRPAAQPVRRRPFPPGGRTGGARGRPDGLHLVPVTVNETPADAAVGEPLSLLGPPWLRERWPAWTCACRPWPSCRPTAPCASVLYDVALRLRRAGAARGRRSTCTAASARCQLPLARASPGTWRRGDPGAGHRRRHA